MLLSIAGILGIAIGKITSDAWKKEKIMNDGRQIAGNQRADAEICAIGQFVFACGTLLALYSAKKYPTVTWAAQFIGKLLV